MGGHQNGLTLFQEVPDEIRDCVRLSGPRRPLHQHRIRRPQALGDLQLFLIGWFAKENVVLGRTFLGPLAIVRGAWLAVIGWEQPTDR